MTTTLDLPTSPTAGVDQVARVQELLDNLDPVVLAIALVRYAEIHGTGDALLTTLALAVEVTDLRAPGWRDDYAGGRYHRNHLLPEFTELQRRRWPPTGNRDLWVRYGPAGPPLPARSVRTDGTT